MKIPANAPREEFGVQGAILTLPLPFKEGHPLTANEAVSMNQTLKENVRNNLSPKIKEALEKKLAKPAMQTLVDKYVEDYEFGVKRSSVTKDPVLTEAINLALEKVKESLSKKGQKIADFKVADLRAKAAQVVEKYPQFLKKAAEVVAARKGGVNIDNLEI